MSSDALALRHRFLVDDAAVSRLQGFYAGCGFTPTAAGLVRLTG